MNPRVKHVFKIIAGVLLIGVGIFALLTPFTPGSWLAFIGLEFIGLRTLFTEHFPWWQKKETQEDQKSEL